MTYVRDLCDMKLCERGAEAYAADQLLNASSPATRRLHSLTRMGASTEVVAPKAWVVPKLRRCVLRMND